VPPSGYRRWIDTLVSRTIWKRSSDARWISSCPAPFATLTSAPRSGGTGSCCMRRKPAVLHWDVRESTLEACSP